jgi:hypothetical protein
MAKQNYTRLWMVSAGKVKKAWISETDVEGVFVGLQQRFGKKLFDKRPTKAFLAGSEAIKKPVTKEAVAA